MKEFIIIFFGGIGIFTFIIALLICYACKEELFYGLLKAISPKYLDLRYNKQKEVLITIDGWERWDECTSYFNRIELDDKRVSCKSSSDDSDYLHECVEGYYCYTEDLQKVLKYLCKKHKAKIKDVSIVSHQTWRQHIHVQLPKSRMAIDYFKEISREKHQLSAA